MSVARGQAQQMGTVVPTDYWPKRDETEETVGPEGKPEATYLAGLTILHGALFRQRECNRDERVGFDLCAVRLIYCDPAGSCAKPYQH